MNELIIEERPGTPSNVEETPGCPDCYRYLQQNQEWETQNEDLGKIIDTLEEKEKVYKEDKIELQRQVDHIRRDLGKAKGQVNNLLEEKNKWMEEKKEMQEKIKTLETKAEECAHQAEIIKSLKKELGDEKRRSSSLLKGWEDSYILDATAIQAMRLAVEKFERLAKESRDALNIAVTGTDQNRKALVLAGGVAKEPAYVIPKRPLYPAVPSSDTKRLKELCQTTQVTVDVTSVAGDKVKKRKRPGVIVDDDEEKTDQAVIKPKTASKPKENAGELLETIPFASVTDEQYTTTPYREMICGPPTDACRVNGAWFCPFCSRPMSCKARVGTHFKSCHKRISLKALVNAEK